MEEDSLTVFKKYKSLMKYIPTQPPEKYRIRLDNNDNVSAEEQEMLR